jgi:nickel-dependent lactate racemase
MTQSPPARVVAAPSQLGDAHGVLADDAVRRFVHEHLAATDLDGARVCVLVPDATRSCPLPLLLDAVHGALHGRVAALTVLVALGTHADLDDDALAALVGCEPGGVEARYPGTAFRTHAWWDPDTFVEVGTVPAHRVAALSEGRLARDVPVRLNRAVVDHDVLLVLGPVFPHEVVGFSGGYKYLIPGVAGRELIDLSHWLGALLSSAALIGTTGVTPVRAFIHEAAALVPGRHLAFCLVVESGSEAVHSIAFGDPIGAWAAAADVAAESHVRYLDRPVRRVLSLMPERYDDLWTGAKGFYKVEPVVADGGQVVIYAPHITEVSAMHPAILEIGYHCRDYFLHQWDRFAHHSWTDLAHSTHLRGGGTWDPVDGERCRVTVTLATGIPADVVAAVGLDHLDPRTIDLAAWSADPDTLVVPNAGEDLYRLAP